MGLYKNKAYTLRIDNTAMDKLRVISELEDRTINKQIERLVKNYIKTYESEHGEIQIEKDQD